MKNSGSFCIEDYCLRDSSKLFTAAENEALTDIVGAVYVPSKGDYRKQLEDAGFSNIEFEDLTETWSQWTVERRNRFLEKKDQQIKLHGEEVYKDMEMFYNTVAKLFQGGRLGGVRITGCKGAVCPDLTTGRQLIKNKTRGLDEIMANVNKQI